MSWIIREERAGDEAAIDALTRRSFTGHPYSDGDEQDVIARLRADGDLLLSLVAERNGELIGQATYSRAILSNGEQDWMVIGPIAVDPSCQGEGIGRALMEAGETALKAQGAKGVTALGDPQLYSRFGYLQHTAMTLDGELGEYLQVKSFGAQIPAATLTYAPAFG
ncbi:GNAT family N-acetyltransferase [Aurantiacibacter sp. D1-12]|uniref:GNAT family N-acetyltransferase n=1 Tax=Aurantiacibacter sp. D1-12 TaxID=2993658 RepID=UPI00237D1E50|nr:N-acetyltransferase [Aurantiacibacter sp. D1-12]MDE1467410.1 N-acetyltransferase [Aurantiacibacter sp. D1-12]